MSNAYRKVRQQSIPDKKMEPAASAQQAMAEIQGIVAIPSTLSVTIKSDLLTAVANQVNNVIELSNVNNKKQIHALVSVCTTVPSANLGNVSAAELDILRVVADKLNVQHQALIETINHKQTIDLPANPTIRKGNNR